MPVALRQWGDVRALQLTSHGGVTSVQAEPAHVPSLPSGRKARLGWGAALAAVLGTREGVVGSQPGNAGSAAGADMMREMQSQQAVLKEMAPSHPPRVPPEVELCASLWWGSCSGSQEVGQARGQAWGSCRV